MSTNEKKMMWFEYVKTDLYCKELCDMLVVLVGVIFKFVSQATEKKTFLIWRHKLFIIYDFKYT